MYHQPFSIHWYSILSVMEKFVFLFFFNLWVVCLISTKQLFILTLKLPGKSYVAQICVIFLITACFSYYNFFKNCIYVPRFYIPFSMTSHMYNCMFFRPFSIHWYALFFVMVKFGCIFVSNLLSFFLISTKQAVYFLKRPKNSYVPHTAG